MFLEAYCEIFGRMNDLIELLYHEIQLLHQLVRLGELSELHGLDECLIELLGEMMRCIYLHH